MEDRPSPQPVPVVPLPAPPRPRAADPAARQEHFLLRTVNKTVREHGMVSAGDRVLVAVSGGKDSLSLLRLLLARRRAAAEPHALMAVHVVDGERRCGACARPEDLRRTFEEAGIPYRFREAEATTDEDGDEAPLTCATCSRARRKQIFLAAEEMGAGVIAFGHHADDAAQTALMNLVFHGELSTMAPVREFFGGRFRVVRPLIDVAEADLSRFARACAFPIPEGACPVGAAGKRAVVADLLRALERHAPDARANLVRAALRAQSAAPIP